MKINNKGFMLIEVIVTSTIALTTLLVLYTGFSKLYNNYKTKNAYHDIDGIYASKTIIEEMSNVSSESNDYLSNFITDKFYGNGTTITVGYLINNNNCSVLTNECNKIKDLYGIKNMILIEYDTNILEAIKGTSSNQTMKDYIGYLITYYDIEMTKNNYNYIVVTELETNDKYTYSSLRIR